MRTSRVGLGLAAVVAAGLGVAAFGIWSPPRVQPPTPSSPPHATSGAAPVPTTGAAQVQGQRVAAVARSDPIKLSFPALKIATTLGPPRGLTPQGTIDDAPLSGPDWALPWWYEKGSSPGQPGSAVLLGHVDSAAGAGHLGVFFPLGRAQRGDTVSVTLADHTVTHWSVRSVTLYPDGRFPDAAVYRTTGPPILRLVTCGGSFDSSTGRYRSALVVTAVLAGTG